MSNYLGTGLKMTANPDGVTNYSWSENMDINLILVRLLPFTTEADRDTLSIIVGPGTNAGATTADAFIGDNTFQVDASVLSYIPKPGWFVVTITDGVFTRNLGRVTAVGVNTITTANSINRDFASGSTIKVDTYIMDEKNLYREVECLYGRGLITNSVFIPANTTVRFRYNNTTRVPKPLLIDLEYLW